VRWGAIAEARTVLERERGTITRDWGGVTPIVLAYPNTYFVGMSSLGFQTMYRLLNEAPGLVCERMFHSFARAKRKPAEPLISLESQRRLDEFAALAFSISFETDYLNMIQMLRRSGVPPLAGERDESYPLLLAGGPAVSANPEPLSPVLDAIVIGEAEEVVASLAEVLAQGLGESKAQLLNALGGIPGVYVPRLHDYAAQTVQRRWTGALDEWPTHSVVLTQDTEFGDMYLLEIARGCRSGCRFCLAGFLYRPMRERSIDCLVAQAEEGLCLTDRIGLVASSVSQYSHIDELAGRLRGMGARLSVSSLRADSLSDPLMRALADSGARTLTIAPEAGSERLRRVINKNLTREELLHAADIGRGFGFAHMKLYFMLGLPTETEEDSVAIATLVTAMAERFKREVSVKLTPFVPKAHTPFECEAMAEAKVLKARIAMLRKRLRPAGINVQSESVEWARVQGVLARGDQRVGRAISSLEQTNLASWKQCMAKAELRQRDYLGSWSPGRELPWRVVDTGIDSDFLERERTRASNEEGTPFCPVNYASCTRCGVCSPVDVPEPD